MEKEKLKELIASHKGRFLARTGFLRRDIQDELNPLLSQKEVILITGIRRCGKSTLMRLICEDLLVRDAIPEANILYLNFDDERFTPFTWQDFEGLYETYLELEEPKGRMFFFLDEVQNIPGWERWLNRLYEFEDIKIFVSGSNASLLGADTSTALTGRNRQLVVWPFSFREYLSMRGLSFNEKSPYRREKRIEIRKHMREYIELGGFPEVLKNSNPSLLEQYFHDILYRDVIARYSVKNIREIKELCLYLASNPGTLQSYQNLQRLTGLKSIGTVKNYLEALHQVFLFHYLDLFDFSVKRQIYNPSKVYGIDTALGCAISFQFSRNLGHLYEQVVFLELLRRKKDIYYWKSKKGLEVDFIVKEGLQLIEAVQVCASMDADEVRKREVTALMSAKTELDVQAMKIVTYEEDGAIETDRGTIQVISLWRWLLA